MRLQYWRASFLFTDIRLFFWGGQSYDTVSSFVIIAKDTLDVLQVMQIYTIFELGAFRLDLVALYRQKAH